VVFIRAAQALRVLKTLRSRLGLRLFKIAHFPSRPICECERMLPSVIGGPAGCCCFGAISIRWRGWRWVQVRRRTFFDFSRFAQFSQLGTRGVVLVLIHDGIHKGTVSGLAGAGHQSG
jgi:hypothetical protein